MAGRAGETEGFPGVEGPSGRTAGVSGEVKGLKNTNNEKARLAHGCQPGFFDIFERLWNAKIIVCHHFLKIKG